MAVPASELRTIEDARTMAGIYKARMHLMSTAMADALATAEAARPDACEQIVRILTKARAEHLARTKEDRA